MDKIILKEIPKMGYGLENDREYDNDLFTKNNIHPLPKLCLEYLKLLVLILTIVKR
jgi:hypothetical protein